LPVVASLKKWVSNRWVLTAMAVLLVFFNFADAALSFWAIYIARIAYEGNPLMAAVMGISPYLFLVFKVILPTACVVFLFKNRDYWMARWGLILGFWLYAGLMVHFGFLLRDAALAGLI